MTFNQPWHAIQGHYEEQAQHKENSARLAFANGFLSVSGAGEQQIEDSVRFGCVFAEKPSVATGWSIDGDALFEGQFPRISAGVCGWDTNQNGHYVGAFIMVTVDIPVGAEEDLSYDLSLDFTFAGIAIKNVPDYLLDE